MNKTLVILGLAFASLTSSMLGAAGFEHPRVAELEDKLAKDAHTYLKGRFPDLPFLVTVKLDPMFRSERNDARGSRPERLPYFDLDSEEIRDEWDDPELSLMALMQRIRKASITVSLPSTTSETETAEIRDSLYNLLHLNQARDEVTIQRRSWSSEGFRWEQGALGVLGLLVFLTGLMLINRASTSRLAKALSDSKGGSSTVVMPSMPSNAARTPREKNSSSSLGGNVKVNDPIKLKDIVVRMAESLSRHKGFPTHLDIFEMDAFGRKNPSALGALIVEFPPEVQRKIFSFSSHDCWLEALNEPGVLDLEVLEMMQKLMRNNRDEHLESYEQLILSVWRLDDTQRAQFVKSLTKEEGMAILHAMPKGVALSTARNAFPGSWAEILDTEAKNKPIGEPRMREIKEMALAIKPMSDASVLRRYRQELELLSHLRTSDPYEEREIYQVLPENSQIRGQRAPFFPVFDAATDLLKKMVNAVTLDQWAMVLLDAKPNDKAKIEELFNDKQRFIYNEKVRELTALKHIDQDEAGAIREQLAIRLQQLAQQKESEAKLADKSAKDSALKMKRRKGLVDEDGKKPGPKDINRAA